MIIPGTNAEMVKELIAYQSLNLLAKKVNVSLDALSRVLRGEEPSYPVFCKLLRYYCKLKLDS